MIEIRVYGLFTKRGFTGTLLGIGMSLDRRLNWDTEKYRYTFNMALGCWLIEFTLKERI